MGGKNIVTFICCCHCENKLLFSLPHTESYHETLADGRANLRHYLAMNRKKLHPFKEFIRHVQAFGHNCMILESMNLHVWSNLLPSGNLIAALIQRHISVECTEFLQCSSSRFLPFRTPISENNYYIYVYCWHNISMITGTSQPYFISGLQ